MKKTSKLLALFMVMVLLTASLAACGSKQEEGGQTGTGTAAGTEGSEAAGDQTDTFTIGGIGPLTGAAASYGLSVQHGAQIAVDEINAAGGVKVGDTTYTFALKFEDDEASEDKAITAYNALMDQGVDVIMGSVTSGSCLAVIDSTYQDGILQITPSGSAQDCTKYDNAFRVCFTDPLQGVTMADYMVETAGVKKIAVIYNTADEYSTGIKDAFVEEVKAKGGEVVAEEAFQTDDKDFSSQLSSIKKTGAEAIFVPAYYQDATYITKQAKEQGVELPFYGSDGWDGVLGTVTDTATVEGAIFLSPFFAGAQDDMTKNFVSTFETSYGGTPDQFAADGYDCVYIYKAALEQAGMKDSGALIAAMTEIQLDGLTGTGISFTEDGEPNKGAKFIQIVDGAYTLMD